MAASSGSTCSSLCPDILITSLLLAEVDKKERVDVLAFWGRRFRRLLPAVLLLLVVVTVVTTIVATVPERAATLDDGPWAQVYLANWHAIAGQRDYWASFELPRMFGHLWSLAIEEQFYVIWPVVIALIAWRSRNVHRAVIIACVVASVLSLAQMIRLFNLTDPTRVYVGTDTRASSLLLGALFATAPLRAVAVEVDGALGPGPSPLSQRRWPPRSGSPGFSSTAPVRPGCSGEACSPIHCWRPCSSPVAQPAPMRRSRAGIGWTPIRVIGVLSYSLYLWHWPIYALLSEERTGMSGWPLTSLRIGLAIIAAAISKQLVEDPIRFRAKWARGRTGVMTLIGVSALIGAFWVLVPRPAVAPAVFSLDQFTSTTAISATSGPPVTTLAHRPADARRHRCGHHGRGHDHDRPARAGHASLDGG